MNTTASPLTNIDLSGDAARQVVIAAGTPEIYQGHPTTLLLPDGQTLLATWCLNHGGACGPLKRSEDGGLTWSELLPVPENWKTVKNCPALYYLTAPDGAERIFIFAGQGPDGTMHQTFSEDGGHTWTPMESNGLTAVMPFCTIVPISNGAKLLALTNIRRPGEPAGNRSNILAQSESTDGGLTWSPLQTILDVPGSVLCEPELVRSPDGGQLLCLIRENERSLPAVFITSDDAGRTWSSPKPLPPGLHGDRHKAVQTEQGDLVVCFRDMSKESPFQDHFVAWVGTYADIVEGRPGRHRVKLLHSHSAPNVWDCGYPGLERLPDGTLVATTYIKYQEGPEKHSIVSVRFRLEDLVQK